jgi:hypothetical protein
MEREAFAVHLVLEDRGRHQGADADVLEVRDRRQQILAVLHRLDPCELLRQRLEALLRDRHGVHRRVPEVADQLPVAALRHLLLRRLATDREQPLIGGLLDHVPDAPRALVGRNRMVLEPLPDRELEEVGARVGEPVDELVEVVLDVAGRG